MKLFLNVPSLNVLIPDVLIRAFVFLALALPVGGQVAGDGNGSDKDKDLSAPSHSSQTMPRMPGMAAGPAIGEMSMQPASLVEALPQHPTSGTDAEPNSTPFGMLMTAKGSWTFMFHGEAFLSEIQQSGPRGRDKLFSTNWWMPMAQRKFGRGTLTLRTMLSFEPATVSGRRYPELFQQGETAFGHPIVDGQHPHDFFMELAALYDYKLAEHTLLSVYAAPMGDPAMGPPAYPHRASASENPVASLGHHLQDSTHIAADVITVGLTQGNFRIEGSGFHGREPDELRWNIDSGKIDSWSARITANPGQNWSLQYSFARLHSPEALAPAADIGRDIGRDIRRMTASIQYNHPLRKGNWASMLLWGRNREVSGKNIGNSYLLESTMRFLARNYAWTRIENVDRTNELLLGENAEPAGFPASFNERYFTRVQAYTAGYAREVGHIPHLATALGAQASWYGVPDVLKPIYGEHPLGVMLFLRLSVH